MSNEYKDWIEDQIAQIECIVLTNKLADEIINIKTEEEYFVVSGRKDGKPIHYHIWFDNDCKVVVRKVKES